MEVSGWAVLENDEIDLRTVSPSRLGAMVNGLILHRRVVVLKDTPEEVIERAWMISRGPKSRCVQVLVKLMEN